MWKTLKESMIIIIIWTIEYLRPMDERTRNLMTFLKALHPSDVIDILRKERGRGFISIENCVDISMSEIDDYIKNF